MNKTMLKKGFFAFICILLVIGQAPAKATTDEDPRIKVVFFEENGLYGLKRIDNDEVVIPARFSDYGYWQPDMGSQGFPVYNEKFARVEYSFVEQDGYYGVVDSEGAIIAETEWDSIDMVYCDYVFVEKDGRTGVIRNNTVILKPEWSFVGYQYYGDYFNVSMWDPNPNGWEGRGICWSDGTIAIPPVYEDLDILREGYVFYRSGDLWGILDQTGKVITEPKFELTGFRNILFSEGLACVEMNGLYGYVDYSGDFVIEAKYSYGRDFVGGVAIVEDADTHKCGLINKAGEYVKPPEYSFSELYEELGFPSWDR